jgi:hypothetical protein
MSLPHYAGLSGDVFQPSAGLQALAYERLWLKEELSAPFRQKKGAGKKRGPAKKGKNHYVLFFQIITLPLANH